MRSPDTKYTKRGAWHIAYQVVGEGPIDLLFVSEWLGHLDAQWEQPRIADFLGGLARFSLLILFNPRGMGASDPFASLEAPTAEEWVDDALVALDATRTERAGVLGAGAGGTIALLLAASHPQRISSLIVFNATARTAWAEDYPIRTPPEYLRRAEEFMRRSYPGPGALALWAPDLVGDELVSDWIVRFLRVSASPGTAVAVQQMLFRLDVRAALPAITAPTLVLHRAETATLARTWVGTSRSTSPAPFTVRCPEPGSRTGRAIRWRSSARRRNSSPACATIGRSNACSRRSCSPTSSAPRNAPPSWAMRHGARCWSDTTRSSDVSSNGIAATRSRPRAIGSSRRSTARLERSLARGQCVTRSEPPASTSARGCTPVRSRSTATTSQESRCTSERG